jgi:hypothetical protein
MAWSVRLWLAAVVVTMITAGLALLNFDQLHGQLLAEVVREFPDEQPATRERVAAVTLLVLIGSGVLVGLLQAGFALAMRSRRRFARLALVPLWLLGAVHALFVLGTVVAPVLLGLPVAVGLSAIASVLMFLPASNAWLARSAVRHRTGRAS